MACGIAILGSTGSIGRTTLRVVSWLGEEYRVVALSGGRNWEELAKQAQQVKPRLVATAYPEVAEKLTHALEDTDIKVAVGGEGLDEVASHPQADIVVSAIVGSAGLLPTMTAIKCGKRIALANKETLVLAGGSVMAAA